MIDPDISTLTPIPICGHINTCDVMYSPEIGYVTVCDQAGPLTETCCWCGNPAGDTCHELHYRPGGWDYIGRAPLCGPCVSINDNLWASA
ncbi:hypothetical protein [Nocardia flavorosea]|uniref:Uncharacterized protein n=1 Tax=Nocardia flavorosea TaxID=53429 RepID=A0A846YMS8_9NOCA|nr:hypothetical protein [Nocardia flavorosea]NKY60417.1 hypothetical protein [Nocardia flavorosea]